MAYMSKETKKELAPAIRKILKKYNIKGTLAVKNYSTLVLNVKSGDLDIIGSYTKKNNVDHEVSYLQVNTYYTDDHYTGKVKNFLSEISDAMNKGNFDKSDLQTDYFHVGWYTDINIGQWDKPYIHTN